LAQKDIRFARTIQRLQRAVVSELEKIGIIHLYTLGFRGNDLISFKLSLSNPSKIAALQELEHWKAKFDVASAATEGYFSKRWVAQTIFGISDEEFIRIQREQYYDRKLAKALEAIGTAEESGGGGGGMGLGGGLGGETPAPEGGGETPPAPEAGGTETPAPAGGEAAGGAAITDASLGASGLAAELGLEGATSGLSTLGATGDVLSGAALTEGAAEAVTQALPYTESYDAWNLAQQGLGASDIASNISATGIDPFIAEDMARLATQGLSAEQIAATIGASYSEAELAGTGIKSLQAAVPSKLSISPAQAMMGLKLASGLLGAGKTPQQAQAQQYNQSRVPQGAVDYSPTLNLLSIKQPQRSKTSLLG
jgi:hypothetical protein